MNQTASIFNPSMDSTTIFKNIIFFGEKINNWLVAQLNNVIPLTDTQNSILLYTVYLVMLLFVIRSAEKIKPILKIGIIILLVILIVGFFRF